MRISHARTRVSSPCCRCGRRNFVPNRGASQTPLGSCHHRPRCRMVSQDILKFSNTTCHTYDFWTKHAHLYKRSKIKISHELVWYHDDIKIIRQFHHVPVEGVLGRMKSVSSFGSLTSGFTSGLEVGDHHFVLFKPWWNGDALFWDISGDSTLWKLFSFWCHPMSSNF